MKARLLDLAVSLTGKQRLTVELDGDFRSTWDELNDTDCEITVKKYRKKRSLDANGYAWLLIDKIAAKKHLSKTEVYRNAIREIGDVSDLVAVRKSAVGGVRAAWESKGLGWQVEDIGSKIPGWTMLVLYYGSSSFDTAQMSRLIDSIVQDARSLGIETEDENKINSLLEEYDKYVEHGRNSRTLDR